MQTTTASGWPHHSDALDTTAKEVFSSWVRSKRPRGAPRYTYGRSLYKTLKKAGIEPDEWHDMAFNKVKWRDMIRNLNILEICFLFMSCDLCRVYPVKPIPLHGNVYVCVSKVLD